MAEPSSTRRRFWQFSLRGLLVLLALVAIAFGIWRNASAQREWRALQAFDKGLRVSLTRRNSVGSLEYVQGFQGQAQKIRLGDPPAPWVLWRGDTVQSFFVTSTEPRMSAAALDPFWDIPTIERLELYVHEMDPRSLQSLEGLSQLESFQWDGDFDEACLLALPRMPSVKRLELAPQDYRRMGKGLQALERLPTLSHLILTPDAGDGEEVMRHAKLSPTPLALEIGSDPQLGSTRRAFDLSDMSAWSSVYYLKLSQLAPKGPIDFASMPNLQTVQFDSVQLSADDVKQLARLPKLERVTLGHTGITDLQVARLLSNPNLRGIVVRERDVSSMAFEGLPDCHRLESLKVPERAVDAEFLESLRKAPALEECEVFPGTNNLRRDNDLSTLQWQIDEVLKKK